MKRLNIIKYGRWMCGLALLLAGCVKDGTELPGDGPRPGDEVVVKFRVENTDDVQITTRSESLHFERNIERLVMVVFGGNGDIVFRQYFEEPHLEQEYGGSNTWTLRFIPVGSFANSTKIVFLANYEPGDELARSINDQYKINDSEYYHSRLSMYGETTWNEIISNPYSPVQLFYPMAKVQVQVSANIEHNFESELDFGMPGNYHDEWAGARWVFGNSLPLNMGLIYPTDTDKWPECSATDFRDFSTQYVHPFCLVDWSNGWGDPDDRSISHTPAYPNATKAKQATVDKNTFHKDRTCIILSVPYKLDQNKRVYYRLDFSKQTAVTSFDTPAANEFIDIKPNTHYIFNITRVRSKGYATKEEALANPGSNIEYTITEDNSEWESMTSNGQYAVKTDCQICDVTLDKTEANDLLKFAAQLPDAGQKPGGDLPTTVETRTVRLVQADKSTVTPVSEMQLCKADGTAIPGNTWNFSDVSNADLTAGYQLKYKTTSAFPTNACYVEITYGNIKHYVPVRRNVFTVMTPPNTDFPYTGGTKSFLVESYSAVGASTQQEMPWTSSMISDDGDSSWVTLPSGGTEGGIVICTVSPDDPKRFNEHDYALQRTPSAGYTVDLSTINSDIGMETTANCYIVNASGTYSLPLVYGNALKNGQVNFEALYNPAISSSDNQLIRNVYNSADVIFDEPAIPLDGGRFGQAAVKDAVVIWQDVKDLIMATSIDRYSRPWPTLTFMVNSDVIKQGNAVIGIRDVNNKIMWSWHIWVTDYKLGEDVITMRNYSGLTYEVMPLNLGWCYGDHLKYEGRSVHLLFTQAETGLTQTVELIQTPFEMEQPGSAPYYQWGRKDPMLPSMFDIYQQKYVDKPVYIGNYGLTPTVVKSSASIGTAISNPHIFYSGGSNNSSVWYNASATESGKNRLLNLWDFTSQADYIPEYNKKVAKTIYDPSPAGYCVPPAGAFDGFTTTGNDAVDNMSLINGYMNDHYEWYFYDAPNGSGDGGHYYPSIGYRYGDGVLRDVRYPGVWSGYYWSAGAVDSNYGWCSLKLAGNAVTVKDGCVDFINKGMSVRAVKEK